jgi:DNA polymerase III epsilon subunit family exonuclease
MVKGKPFISEVMPAFLDFTRDSVLVAYNSGFDLGFLESALGDNSELIQGFKVIDALKLARNLFPEVGRYNLGFLAERLGISINGQHRALADAMITAKVFKKEIDILLGKGINLVDEIAEGPMIRKIFKAGTGDALFETIMSAINNQNMLNITYRSSWDNTMSERTITPREIKNGFDRRYVIAYCHLKKEVRNFRMDCILSAKPA